MFLARERKNSFTAEDAEYAENYRISKTSAFSAPPR
jgi:hypothetical protein